MKHNEFSCYTCGKDTMDYENTNNGICINYCSDGKVRGVYRELGCSEWEQDIFEDVTCIE